MTPRSSLNNLVDGGFLPGLVRWEVIAAVAEPLLTTTHCLSGSMVLPDVELLYISPPLRRGGKRWTGRNSILASR